MRDEADAEPTRIHSEPPIADTISFSPSEADPEPAYEAPAEEPLPAALATPTELASEQFGDVTPQDANAGLAFAADQVAAPPQPDEFDEAFADVEASPEVAAPRSIMPLPTGILRRPAIAAGWQPVAAKRPQPHAGSGLFRYAAGSLPVPSKPPRPDLRPDQRLQPAAGPARA
jgi:hypothetical protein